MALCPAPALMGWILPLLTSNRIKPKLIAADFTPMPANLREKVTALIQSGETSLQALGELDHQFGLLYADCVNAFLHKIPVKT